MGNCFSSPSPSHSSGPGPSPGITRLPDTAGVGGVLVPGLPADNSLALAGLHGRASLDHGTGPRPLPDPTENAVQSSVKVGVWKKKRSKASKVHNFALGFCCALRL